MRTACRSGLSWGSMLEWAMASATELVSAKASRSRTAMPEGCGSLRRRCCPCCCSAGLRGAPDEVCDEPACCCTACRGLRRQRRLLRPGAVSNTANRRGPAIHPDHVTCSVTSKPQWSRSRDPRPPSLPLQLSQGSLPSRLVMSCQRQTLATASFRLARRNLSSSLICPSRN